VRALSTISHSTMRSQRTNLLERLVSGFARHWLFFVNVLIAIWVGLPWLAPVLMDWGWTSAAKVIYFIYSFQCHQLPERSFFLFGGQAMYSLTEIQIVWQQTTNPLILLQFIGTPEMGWKVAWSDRMVWMYTSILFGGLLYGLVRKQMKPISLERFSYQLLSRRCPWLFQFLDASHYWCVVWNCAGCICLSLPQQCFRCYSWSS
jgi:hypothetical protein